MKQIPATKRTWRSLKQFAKRAENENKGEFKIYGRTITVSKARELADQIHTIINTSTLQNTNETGNPIITLIEL